MTKGEIRTITISSQQELNKGVDLIAPYLKEYPVAAFYGQMGAGKTTFISVLCSCLGVTDHVTSPTFALINRYATPDGGHINHFDLYRLERPEEAFDIGCEEYFESGEICLIEWPEKIDGFLPEPHLRIGIEHVDDSNEARRITLEIIEGRAY